MSGNLQHEKPELFRRQHHEIGKIKAFLGLTEPA